MGLVLAAFFWREPVYHGRKASVWVEELNSVDGSVQEKAYEAIGELGPGAIPALTKTVRITGRGRHPKLQDFVVSVATRLPKKTAKLVLDLGGVPRGYFAGSGSAIALQAMGADAKPAIPELLAALEDEDPNVRSHAACALLAIAPEDREVMARLCEKIPQDSQAWIFSNVANGFDALPPGNETPLPLIQAALTNAQPYVRMQAFRALGKFPAEAARFEPQLRSALRDADLKVRVGAAVSLSQWGKTAAAELIPVFLAGVQSPDLVARNYSIAGLAKLGPTAHEALPTLQGMLSASQPIIRVKAANALRQIEPQRAVSGTFLKPGLGKMPRDPMLSLLRVFQFLDQVDPAEAERVPELISLLKNHDPEVQSEVLKALRKLGGRAAPAVPAITGLLADPVVETHLRAAEALWSVSHRTEALLPTLQGWLKTDGTYTRFQTAKLLGEMGPSARDALPLLKGQLNDPSALVRDASEKAIGKIEK